MANIGVKVMDATMYLFMLIVALGLLVLCGFIIDRATSYDVKDWTGVVVSKTYAPSHTETTFIPVANGSSTTLIQQTNFVDESWSVIIRITEYNGMDTISVTKEQFSAVTEGDTVKIVVAHGGLSHQYFIKKYLGP